MFLFTKKTRNIIKIFWGIFATLIIISMVVAFSGFTMLAGTQATRPVDISPDDLRAQETEVDFSDLGTSSPELAPLLESIRADMETPSEPTQPPVPPLRFDL